MKIKSAKGFSLIEILIVTVIMAILMSMAVPTFNKFRDNTNLREAARGISSDIQEYRQRAISENIHYRINFDAAGNIYTIRRETVLDSDTYADVMTKNVGASNANIVISGTPSFSGGVPHVIFNPRGTTGAGSLDLIHIIRHVPPNSLCKATITTTTMGRVRVTYEIK